jgi:hypothetical protein
MHQKKREICAIADLKFYLAKPSGIEWQVNHFLASAEVCLNPHRNIQPVHPPVSLSLPTQLQGFRVNLGL